MALLRTGVLIHPEELGETWLSRLAGTGLNTLGLHPVGGEEADRSLEELLGLWPTAGFQRLLDRVRALGLAVEIEAHAMSHLLPRDLFPSHPEWFRMDENGERTPRFNACPSSAEAMDFLAERAAWLVRLLPSDTHRYAFWVDDVLGGSCRCPLCRDRSESDQQALLVGAMLRGAKAADPLARMPYLAYNACMLPPKVPLEAGLYLEYAPIRRDLGRPLSDPASEKNVSQILHLPELLRLFSPAEAQALDYWLDNSMLSGWKKPPKPFRLQEDVMRADVGYYRSLGFGSVTSFGCYLGDDYAALYGEPPVRAYADILTSGD